MAQILKLTLFGLVNGKTQQMARLELLFKKTMVQITKRAQKTDTRPTLETRETTIKSAKELTLQSMKGGHTQRAPAGALALGLTKSS